MATLAALTFFSSNALGDAPPGRVATLVSGPGASEVNRAIVASLPPSTVAVDPSEVESAVKAGGITTKMKLPLDDAESRALTNVAASNHIDAFVIAVVQRTPHARQVTLEVLDLSRPAPHQPHALRLGLRPAASDSTKLATLTGVLSGLSGPPGAEAASAPVPPPPPVAPPVVVAAAPPPPPPPPPQDAPKSPPQRPEGDPASSLIRVGAAFDLGTRKFAYKGAVSTNLRPYTGAAAPAVAVEGELFPFAEMGNYFLRNIGVEGGYRGSIGLASKQVPGGSVGTSWSDFDILLRYRVPLGKTHPPVLGLTGGYAREEFVFALPVSSYPSAAYPAVRAGLDLRVPFGPHALTAAGHYLAVLDPVYIGQNFRRPLVIGVDASLEYAFRVATLLELFVAGSYTEYFYSFHPGPNDAYVASGATDQMFHGQLGLRATY